MKKYNLCFLILACWLFGSSLALAGWDTEVFFYGPLNSGLGLSLDSGGGPLHGAVALQYTDQKNVGKGNQLRAGLNTDTLWLYWDLGALTPQKTTWTLYTRGQFGFAQMTPDPFKQGRLIEEARFFSMYGAAGTEMNHKLSAFTVMEAQVEFRYWFFFPQDKTSMTLPLNSPAIRAHVGIRAETERKQFHQGRMEQQARIRARLQYRKRFVHEPWGASFDGVPDPRNRDVSEIGAVQGVMDFELRHCFLTRLCFKGRLSGGLSFGADDLQRFQVGGDLRYIPQVSGTYSSEFLTDAYTLFNLHLFWLPLDWLRIEPQVDIAWLTDIERTGKLQEWGFLLGLGLGLDFFLRHNMRIRAKFGYSPNVQRPGGTGGFKFVVGFVGYWWP